MKQYARMLVVVEPKRDKQVALQRALEIARYNPHAQITLLRVVYDFSYDIHVLNHETEKETRDSVVKTHREELARIIEEYKGDGEIPINPKVVLAADIAEGIICELENGGDYDLVLKAANRHGVLDSLIFTPIDWYVLRNSKVPVIIAKEHEWTEGGNIVVAMDFSLQEKNRMNTVLLREAQMLAAVTRGRIHIVTSSQVILPTVMLEVPHYTPELYATGILKEHRRRMEEFAALHKIPAENCHIAEGLPDDVIPDFCRRLQSTVVFIGSAGRSGVMAALVGNTCEEIVDYVEADLVVMNAKTVKAQKKE